MGSGNIGATNVARVLGTAWFRPGLSIFDFMKGFAPVFWLAPWVADRWRCVSCPAPLVTLAVSARSRRSSGHMWPIYLGFRAGRGWRRWAASSSDELDGGPDRDRRLDPRLYPVPLRVAGLGVAGAVAAVANQLTARQADEAVGGETPWVITIFLGIAAVLVIVRHKGEHRAPAGGHRAEIREEEDGMTRIVIIGDGALGHGAGAGPGAGGPRGFSVDAIFPRTRRR